MCWVTHRTRARFPDCTEKYTKQCLNYDPIEDHILWCVLAEQRGFLCTNIISTSQGASTKRRMNCPRHRQTLPQDPTAQEPIVRKKFGYNLALAGAVNWRFSWSWGVRIAA
ncbi:hypothetical protein BJX64DRAFT_287116 [Aspergillus heterothallicus]